MQITYYHIWQFDVSLDGITREPQIISTYLETIITHYQVYNPIKILKN